MPEMHLRQPRFTYSFYEPLQKKQNKITKIQRNRRFRYMYRNELDKVCFQHDMTYGDFKDLPREWRLAKHYISHWVAQSASSNPKYDGYQRGLASMVYKLCDKKAGQTVAGISENQELASELHKRITRKFQKCNVYSSHWENILSADLANVWLISKYNKRVKFLLRVIDIYSKVLCYYYWNFWVFLLKDRKCIIITNAFQKVLDKSGHTPNEMWADQGSEFYKRSMKSCLYNNGIKMLENLLLLRDLSEPWRVRSTSIRLRYQKLCILIS